MLSKNSKENVGQDFALFANRFNSARGILSALARIQDPRERRIFCCLLQIVLNKCNLNEVFLRHQVEFIEAMFYVGAEADMLKWLERYEIRLSYRGEPRCQLYGLHDTFVTSLL